MNPVMVAAGKKAAVTKAAGGWTFAQAIEGKPDSLRELAHAVQDFMLAIDSAIEEAPKKFYVAYRTTQNVVCMEVQKKKILLFLKLYPAKGPHGISRDVSHIGHYGTGDLEITIRTAAELEKAKPFLRQSYEQMGG
jgi:predicted transport protein